MEKKKYTVAGTDIEEVKRLNAESGPSYNEINEMLTRQIIEKEKNSQVKRLK
ncbi:MULTISPECIES: hypothetical protein [Sporosarcina]|uniref:hypothetical protein n=1 Tax=Sporosarcina TaxID=1569 RepID=UPI001890E117|nr:MULTISPECIES: hypothetical protein [Sporosarcina]GKV64972.1 hypothetical protein NCCP2331_11250 [Sporosarcina sp. NCCP-2331]GLB56607.1 hypothetical protein NCCP2378_23940 [Sporosarcina sp. NCCP-2378]